MKRELLKTPQNVVRANSCMFSLSAQVAESLGVSLRTCLYWGGVRLLFLVSEVKNSVW